MDEPTNEHDPDTCPGCEARRREGAIADQLSLEITQAINRAISKSDVGLDVSVLVAPLAINLALVLLKYEDSGNNFDDALIHVNALIQAYRQQILGGGGLPPGNA